MKKHLPLIGLVVLGLIAITLTILWILDHKDLRAKWVDAEGRYTNYYRCTTNLICITNVMQGTIETKKKEIAKLTDDNKKLESSLASAKCELETAKADLEKQTKLAEENAKIAKEFDTLKKGLEAKTDEAMAKRDEAVKASEILTGETNKLTASVIEWKGKEKVASDLAEKYKKRLLANKIPLEPDKLFLGNVLVVNKEQEFLILDLGSDDMLPVGKEMEVVRDNHVVAKVTIKKLLENTKLSVAAVDSLTDPNNPVQEGDGVKNVQKF